MTDVIDCEYTVEGDGPPLFLSHGIGAARDTWRFALPRLKEHFTVVTYDLRGHGSSAKPDRMFGIDNLVDDLERVRARTGFEKAHFAGHSLGGMIVPAYARKFPDRALSLGILSTAAFRTGADSAAVFGVVKAMEENGIPQTLETLSNRWFTDDFIASHGDIVTRRLEQIIAMDADVFMNVFRIYAGTEMGPWLHQIPHPSLILTGENDGGCNPRLNTLIHAAMPNTELVILPDYKHSLMLECGDLVAQHLVRFITSL